MERIFSDRAGFDSPPPADRDGGTDWNHYAKLCQNHLLRRYCTGLRNYCHRKMLLFSDGRNSESKHGRYGAHRRKDYLVVRIIILSGLAKPSKRRKLTNIRDFLLLSTFYGISVRICMRINRFFDKSDKKQKKCQSCQRFCSETLTKLTDSRFFVNIGNI